MKSYLYCKLKTIFQERDSAQEKLQDLLEENTQLKLSNKSSQHVDNNNSNNDDSFIQNNIGTSLFFSNNFDISLIVYLLLSLLYFDLRKVHLSYSDVLF